MTIQNEKWHQLSVSAVEKQLNTNASCGLSRKEARSRYRKLGPNLVFNRKQKRMMHLSKAFLTDPALLLFLFICFLCLFFFELSAGLTSLICFFLVAVLIVRALILENRLQESIEKYRIPTVAVIRDGTEYVLSARVVVIGDLIYLKKGDIVPADCRLISSSSLSTLTLCVDDDGKVKMREYPKNEAEASPLETAPSMYEWNNILFCGSEILEGSAHAIVIATGDETVVGKSNCKELPAEYGRMTKESATIQVIRPYIRIYSFFLFLLMVPMTLAVLFANKESGFLNGFLSVCAFTAIGSQALLLFYFHLPAFLTRSKFFSAKEHLDRIIFKSDRSVKVLASITDVIILGHGACSDGLLHLDRCVLGDEELKIKEGTVYNDLQSLCEAILLKNASQVDGFAPCSGEAPNDLRSLCRELCELSGFDVEALKTRLLSVSSISHSENLLLAVKVNGGEYRLLFAEDGSLLDRCVFYEKNKHTAVFSAQERTNVKLFIKESQAIGSKIQLVIKQVGTQMIFLGALSLREKFLENVPSLMSEMQNNGVKPTFFFRGSFDEEAHYAKALGISTPLQDASYLSVGELANRTGTEPAFFGADPNVLASAVQLLSQQKRKVAVLGTFPDDCLIMRKALLSVGCDTLFFDDHTPSTAEEEERLSIGCTPNIRRHSDIMICRPSKHGGGLSTFLQGIYECRATQQRAMFLLRFLFLSHIARLTAMLLTTIFSIGSLTSFQLIYDGMLTEALLAFGISTLSIGGKHLTASQNIGAKHIESVFRDVCTWLPTVCSAFFMFFIFAIMKWCGLITTENCISALFGSLLLLQIVSVIGCARFYISFDGIKRLSTIFLLLLIPIILIIAFSVAFPAIHATFLLGKWSLFSTVVMLLIPFFHWIFTRLISSFFPRTAK